MSKMYTTPFNLLPHLSTKWNIKQFYFMKSAKFWLFDVPGAVLLIPLSWRLIVLFDNNTRYRRKPNTGIPMLLHGNR